MKTIKSLACYVIGFSLFTFLFYQTALHKNMSYAFQEGGILKIQDFYYHLVVVDAFWNSRIASIYDYAAQRQVLLEFFGQAANSLMPMPIGVTPTALLLWYPFSLLSKSSIFLAVAAWTSASCFFLMISYWQLLRRFVSQKPSFYLALLSFIVLVLSYALRLAVDLGQTSMIAAGAFILLLIEIRRVRSCGAETRWWLVGGLFFLLSIKITYLFIAGSLLLIYRCFKGLAVGLLLVVSCIIALQLTFDANLIRNYASQLLVYSRPSTFDYFNGSLALSVQNTFRGAFSQLLAESTLLLVSQGICAAFIAFVLLNVLLHKRPSIFYSMAKIANKKILSILSFAVFMLFLTYWGRYEEVLIVVPVCYALLFAEKNNHSALWILGAIVCATVVLNQNIALNYVPLWCLWVIKALLFIPLTGVVIPRGSSDAKKYFFKDI